MSGCPGRVGTKDHQNSFCILLSSQRRIHTGEYASPLRRRFNSNLLHLEAKEERKLWSTTASQSLHLIFLQTVPLTQGRQNTVYLSSILCWSFDFIFSAWLFNTFHIGICSFGPVKSVWDSVFVKPPLQNAQCIADGVCHCSWLYKLRLFFLMARESICTSTYQTIK